MFPGLMGLQPTTIGRYNTASQGYPLGGMDPFAQRSQAIEDANAQQQMELQGMLDAAHMQGVNPWPMVFNTVASMAQLGAGVASLSAGKQRGPAYTIRGLEGIAQGIGSLAGTMAAPGDQRAQIGDHMRGLIDLRIRAENAKTQGLQQVQTEKAGATSGALDLARAGRLAGNPEVAKMGLSQATELITNKPYPGGPGLTEKEFDNWTPHNSVANAVKDILESPLDAKTKAEAKQQYKLHLEEQFPDPNSREKALLWDYATTFVDEGKEARELRQTGGKSAKNLNPMDLLLRGMLTKGLTVEEIKAKKVQPEYGYLQLTGKTFGTTKTNNTAANRAKAVALVADPFTMMRMSRLEGQEFEEALQKLSARADQAYNTLYGMQQGDVTKAEITAAIEKRAQEKGISLKEAKDELRNENPLYRAFLDANAGP